MKRWTLVAASAALALCAGTASAADLGSDGVADLEERIAELEATTARKGNKKVSLEIYGQVNAGLLYIDTEDFSDTKVTQFGSDSDGTFVGFRGRARVNTDLSAGYVLEIDFHQLGLALDAPFAVGGNPEPNVRQSYFYLNSESVGALSVGRTGQATQDMDRISTANTYVAAKPMSLQPLSDAYLTGLDLPLDGGYRDLVRYDSPILAGFRVSASWGDAVSATDPDGDGDTYDVALRYAGEFSGFKLAAGAGWRHDEDFTLDVLDVTSVTIGSGDVETILLSGSVMHATSGLFLSAYWADQDWKDVGAGVTLKAWHIQGGVENKFLTPAGKTTLYGEYGEFSLETVGTVDAPFYGLGVIQNVEAAALDLWIGYRHYDEELIGDAVDTVSAGAKIKF